MTLLQIRSLRKTFGHRLLIDTLDLDLDAGQTVAVMGESGAGKSTLLNIIAGLETADAGTIRLDGIDVLTLDDVSAARLRRDRVGFVFQAFHVLPHLTLLQNVELPLLLQRRPSAERADRALAMLDSVGLGSRADDRPQALSGGELQRVAIARALVHRPRLLLADEPTGNLDPETASAMLELLGRAVHEAGAAAVLVTHSSAAAATCDRVLRLAHRRLDGSRA